jgi:hypothetical protein
MDVMEEITAAVKAAWHPDGSGKKTNSSTDDAWFWNYYGGSIPKASHTANIFLLQDDVPNALRFFMNSYAMMPGADGILWEAGRLGQYVKCDCPDNGTAGWFLEIFRNLLVMELDEGKTLWIARGTPRGCLKQVSDNPAPTLLPRKMTTGGPCLHHTLMRNLTWKTLWIPRLNP